MRSPTCFILRSVWMVTFFKVHLRIVGPVPSAVPRPGRRPEGSAPDSPPQATPVRTGTYHRLDAAPLHPRTQRGRSDARPQRLVVLRPRFAPGDGAHQVVHVLFALDEVDVAGVDDEERRLLPAAEEIVVGARELGEVVDV